MAVADDAHAGEHDTLPSWNIVVICTVGGVLMLEFITHQMNAAAKGKKHAMELLEGLYRELAILGVVAFVLWSINVSEYVTIEYNDKHLFEQIHMTLFLAALFHSFPIGMVVLYSRQTIRRWDLFEDDEMRRYKDLKQQYRRTAAKLGLRHSQLKRGVGLFKWACLWASHPMLCRRLSELSEHVSYHALRSQFIKNNQLPKNFRFAAYLKKCEQEVVIGLAEIKHGVWVGLILFVGVELYIKGIMGKATSNADGRGLFLLAAVLVIFAALAVHFKLHHIYSALVDTYRPRDDLSQYLGPDAPAQMIQEDMFWFGKPQLLLTAFQTMQFVLAVMVSALIWFGAGQSRGLVIVAEILVAVGAFAIYIVVLPMFIPRFTQVTHIGGMVNMNILSETLLKQKNSFQRRTLPPTLRQISVMARLKSNEEQDHGRFMGTRKMMSGQAFREGMKVMVGVHFFIVAYNTDQIEQNGGVGVAWVAEIVLAGIALLVEIATHFILWRGTACFHFNPFVEVSNRPINTPHKPAATIYPSTSRRQLLEGSAYGSRTPSAGHDQDLESSSPATSTRKETRRVCSVWACFGWRGGGEAIAEGDGCSTWLDGAPPQAVVGAWRTLDLVLILVVLGCAISTGRVDGVTRVVVHAIQGVVVLRLWPLWRCPLPPAVEHGTIRNVDGGTVDHALLDDRTVDTVMEETLILLRRQNPQEGSFGARAIMEEESNNAIAAKHSVCHHDKPSMDTLSSLHTENRENTAEAKSENQGIEHEHDGRKEGIANVGVAMALHEAISAHQDLVQASGPLCLPILRAMLGLDPHKTTPEDDAKAFAIAARAVTLAGSLSRTEEAPGRNANSTTRRAIHRSRSSSVDVSHPPVPSSPSSSDLSDGDTYDGSGRGALGNSQHDGGKRGRISSFLSGSRHYRKTKHPQHHQQHRQQREQRHDQQLSYHQQQLLLYQQQMQVQMQQQQLQYQQYQLIHSYPSTNFGSGTDYHEPPPDTHNADQGTLRTLRAEHKGEITTSSAIPREGDSKVVQHPLFDPLGPGAVGSVSSLRRDASVRSFNSTLHSYSRHSRRGPHGPNTSDTTGGTIAAAIEDLERPVLPSAGNTAGPQFGAINVTGRGARGDARGTGGGRSEMMGAGRVPYSSGRSIAHTSGHRSAWKGTPARTLKGPTSSAHDTPLIFSDDERAVPVRPHGLAGSASRGSDDAGGVARRGLVRGSAAGSVGGADARGAGHERVGLGDRISGTARGGPTEEVMRDGKAPDDIASGARSLATAGTSTRPPAYASTRIVQPRGSNAE